MTFSEAVQELKRRKQNQPLTRNEELNYGSPMLRSVANEYVGAFVNVLGEVLLDNMGPAISTQVNLNVEI